MNPVAFAASFVRRVTAQFSSLAWAALAGLVGVLAITAPAAAQPFNVRAWFAQGQVFVIWEFPAPPALPTDSVEIYASAGAQVSTAAMQRVGKMFFQEYTGARLQKLSAGARLTVPTPAGGTYRLLANEGVFAYTPRANGVLFFAVVNTGSAVVNAANSASTPFTYNPVGDPVRPHPQLGGFTTNGFPYTAYVVWGEGADDHTNIRPDIPVFGPLLKNGVPHVFTITRPLVAPPAGPLPVVFALHGGGGEYELFRPGMPERGSLALALTNGIVVTPDDNLYVNLAGTLITRTTGWFGYVSNHDPFFGGLRLNPPAGSIVVNYTQRRVFWILDWLQRPTSSLVIDPQRVALIGHSNGGRGAWHLARSAPERFSAVVTHTSPFDVEEDENLLAIDFLRGEVSDDLDTNLPDPVAGGVLKIYDVLAPLVRMSPLTAYVPVTRHYFGKRDEDSTASWEASMLAVLDEMNAQRRGEMIFWDEREHGVEKWNTDENDTLDDPAHTDPWPDIGQWVSPVRSARYSAQYLIDTYRASQTYPGFFNADTDLLTAGLQPDPGSGDPDDGEPFGTWGGYLDWDTTTLVDTANIWAATVYTTALSPVSIDNSPFASIFADVIPRKTIAFNPPAGARVAWTATDITSGAITQWGSTLADSAGDVAVRGLNVTADPARVRLSITLCPPPCNLADVTSIGGQAAGVCPDGQLTVDDTIDFVNAFGDAIGCPLTGVGPGTPCNLSDVTDIGNTGAGPDGQLTVDDIIAFVNAFGDGC